MKKKRAKRRAKEPPPPPLTRQHTPPSAEAVAQCLKWTLAGHSEGDILEALQEQFPTENTRDTITAVINHLRASGNADADVIRGWCIEATRQLYLKMNEIGDYAGALKAVKQLAALC